MKKGLVVVLALLIIAFTALPLFALDVQFSGDYRVRYFYFDSIYATQPAPVPPGQPNAVQKSDFFDQRFRLTSKITAGMATGVVQLDFLNTNPNGTSNLGNREYGQTTGGTPGSGFGGEFNNIGVREAYLVVNFPVGKLYTGRKEEVVAHGLSLKDTVDNIGSVGLRFPEANIPSLKVCLFKLAEFDSFTTGHTNNLDLNVLATNVEWTPTPDFLINYINMYALPQRVVGAPHNFWLMVNILSSDGKMQLPGGEGAVRYAFEWDNYTGTNPAGLGIIGNTVYADLATDVNIASAGTVSFGIAYLRSQGASPGNPGKVSNNSLRGDFKFGNILFADSTNNYDGVDLNTQFAEGNVGCNPNLVAGCSAQNATLNNNIHAIKVYAGLQPTNKLDLGVAVFPYVWAVNKAPAGVACQPGGTACGRRVGTEFDVNGGYKFDENLKLTAGYGFFAPGDAFSDPSVGQRAKNVNEVNVALTYTF